MSTFPQMDARLERRILEELKRRNMLSTDGITTVFGKSAIRQGGPGPEALADAAAPQKRLVELAYATPWTGECSCAAWIEEAFVRLGYGHVDGDAFELCRKYLGLDDLAELKVGMAVGVEHHPYGAQGLTYGHIGLYIGDGKILDCADDRVRCAPLALWLSIYGAMDDPRWGWLDHLALDRVKPEL